MSPSVSGESISYFHTWAERSKRSFSRHSQTVLPLSPTPAGGKNPTLQSPPQSGRSESRQTWSKEKEKKLSLLPFCRPTLDSAVICRRWASIHKFVRQQFSILPSSSAFRPVSGLDLEIEVCGSASRERERTRNMHVTCEQKIRKPMKLVWVWSSQPAVLLAGWRAQHWPVN